MARPEDRAASEVIGAVIIFGFLVITFTIYQGVIVPNQNRAIEFEHNQVVQDSIQDLRNAVRQTASTAAEESVSIKLGATYPPRVIAINPGASAGSLQTEPLGSITIRNVSARDDEVADYFGDATTTLGPFESKAIVYHGVYFQYQQAPVTSYENTLAHNRFSSGVNLTLTDQAVIRDQTITLIALDGNVSEAQQGSVSVDTAAVSTATNTVSIESDGGPVNITFGTRLSAADWRDALEDENTTEGGSVLDVRQTGSNQVSIILEEGNYDLRLAKVGVGRSVSSEDPKYIVDAEGDDTSVVENGTQRLVVEVRDRFNNPVSNVTIEADPSQGGLDNTTKTTEADGQAAFIYNATEDVDGAEDVTVQMSFDGDGTENETNVTFNVRVLDADGSGGDGGVSDVNPSGNDKLVLVDTEGGVGGTSDMANLTFDNTGETDITVVAMRVPFYFAEQNDVQVDEVESFAGREEFNESETLEIGAELTELDPTLTFEDGTTEVSIEFNSDDSQFSTENDFFILVLELDSGGTVTYFVAL